MDKQTFDNNLCFITHLSSNNEYFSYLNQFLLILKKISKDHVLKNTNYNIMLPTRYELTDFINSEKKNNTDKLIQYLMRFILPVKNKLKIYNGILTGILMNNNTLCFARTIILDKTMKNIISTKKLNDSKSIYTQYKQEHPYISEKYLTLGYGVLTTNEEVEIFGDLLYINKYYNSLFYSKSYYCTFSVNQDGSLTRNDKPSMYNEESDMLSTDGTSGLIVHERMTVFNKFISDIKCSDNKKEYVNQALSDLLESVSIDDNIKTFTDIIEAKLSPFVIFVIILQPLSLCDTKYLIYNINSDFTLPNKNTLKNRKDYTTHKFSAQQIISFVDALPYEKIKEENIKTLIEMYVEYFKGNDKLAYRVLWAFMLSYHLESILKEGNNDYSNINIDNVHTYAKLYGIKQYTKVDDYYKKRILWIIKLFTEDNNCSLVLSHLYNYCKFMILDDEKRSFLMDITTEDGGSDCSLQIEC